MLLRRYTRISCSCAFFFFSVPFAFGGWASGVSGGVGSLGTSRGKSGNLTMLGSFAVGSPVVVTHEPAGPACFLGVLPADGKADFGKH